MNDIIPLIGSYLPFRDHKKLLLLANLYESNLESIQQRRNDIQSIVDFYTHHMYDQKCKYGYHIAFFNVDQKENMYTLHICSSEDLSAYYPERHILSNGRRQFLVAKDITQEGLLEIMDDIL